jgi:hypothetical protein
MSIRKSKWTDDGVSHWSGADGYETIGVVDVIDGEYVATDVDGNVVGRFAGLHDATRAFGSPRSGTASVSVMAFTSAAFTTFWYRRPSRCECPIPLAYEIRLGVGRRSVMPRAMHAISASSRSRPSWTDATPSRSSTW